MTNKKTYTREFKEEAVRLAQQNDNTSETARSLGIHDSILRRWKKEIEDHQEKAFPGKGHSHEEELRQLQRENQRLKETVQIRSRCSQRRQVQKSNGYLHERPQVRYQFVHQNLGQYSLERLCEALAVSVSGYYSWRKRPESSRKQENKRIVAEIKVIHRQSRETGPDADIVCWSMGALEFMWISRKRAYPAHRSW